MATIEVFTRGGWYYAGKSRTVELAEARAKTMRNKGMTVRVVP